ncbi:putative nucleic-acid-binding protein implicated in transcription termination [hydrocarbon metagenome]|uniref:Putative nucleic-acid-binding protein implicated in transcription termination n=1 Tax=hydrocarbon metagenome TaxID=938273 RepID=A0A0W8E3V7_9ZZZZ
MGKTRKIPQRMCIGCRNMKNKKDLIRIVRTPQGDIELDTHGKKPGRGAYMCADPDCFKKSVKSKGLEKALDKSIPVEIIAHIEKQIQSISS